MPTRCPSWQTGRWRKLWRRIRAMQVSRSSFMLMVRGSSVMTSAMQVLRGSRPSATTRAHQVALGENPDYFIVVQDGDGADIALDHGSYGFEHSVAEIHLVGVLSLDQVADPHFDTSGVTGFRVVQKHLPGREYMPGNRTKERRKSGADQGFSKSCPGSGT